ncbi:LysR family transcriptional regulator [Pelistega europaea]|uniref:LysR family transcriptional regulator n=1 Tax=Pelistega europaea TaxID=106147 RepID=A0A7Y4L9K9_9BURK|nr:LysR family transcriptional regulator [Pelistega europaea]NOL49490.1 LysR family transcriptional regulator [Pelistega europaea]
MDSLQSIRVFCQVVRLGSFTAAAEFLGISTAMASKHINSLEQHVQTKLLNRTSRKLSLTELGEHYYQQCLSALDTLDSALLEMQQGTITPKGTLKITIPLICCTPYFANILNAFREQYRDIQLSIYLENKHTNLVAEGFDLALRVTRSLEPGIIAKPLTKVRFHLVASPSYIMRHGKPQDFQDLKNHYGIMPNYTQLHLPLQVIADSNNTLMTREMALAGMGIAFLPHWLTDEYIQSGRLVQVLDEDESEMQSPTIYAVYADRKFLSAKVRAFIDFLVEKAASKEHKF